MEDVGFALLLRESRAIVDELVSHLNHDQRVGGSNPSCRRTCLPMSRRDPAAGELPDAFLSSTQISIVKLHFKSVVVQKNIYDLYWGVVSPN